MNRALLLVVGTGALALAGTLAGDGPRKETPTARTATAATAATAVTFSAAISLFATF